jgi:hypothetical protein
MPTKDVHEPVAHAVGGALLEPCRPREGLIRTRAGQVEVHNLPRTQGERHEARRDDAKGAPALRLRFPREAAGDVALGPSDDVPPTRPARHRGGALGGRLCVVASGTWLSAPRATVSTDGQSDVYRYGGVERAQRRLTCLNKLKMRFLGDPYETRCRCLSGWISKANPT